MQYSMEEIETCERSMDGRSMGGNEMRLVVNMEAKEERWWQLWSWHWTK